MASNRGNTKTFSAVLYPDDPNYEKTMEIAKKTLDEYTYILHDRDVNKDTGEAIKTHGHLLWHYPEQRSLKAVSEEIGIPENMIEKIHNYNNALIYLIHEKNDNKHQYDESQVSGSALGIASFQKALRQYRMKERSEDIRIMDIVELISHWQGKIKYKDLVTECCSRVWYADLRRSGYIVRRLVDEHNEVFEYRHSKCC